MSRCNITNSLIQNCFKEYPLTSIIKLNNVLKKKRKYSFNKLIDCGLVKHFVTLLSKNNYNYSFFFNGYVRVIKCHFLMPIAIVGIIQNYYCLLCTDELMQICCRSIILNISAGSIKQIQYLVKQNVIVKLLNGLRLKTSFNVKSVSIDCLSNIVRIRKYAYLLLNKKIVSKLYRITQNTIKYTKKLNLYDNSNQYEILHLFNAISNLLCNLSGYVIKLRIRHIVKIMEILKNLKKYTNPVILRNLIFTLKFISCENYILFNSLMVKYDFIQDCCKCLLHKDEDTISSAVICLSNMFCIQDFSRLNLINTNIFPQIKTLLDNNDNIYSFELRKHVCYMISNYARGPLEHIDTLILFRIMDSLINVLNNEPYEIASIALKVFCISFTYTEEKMFHINHCQYRYIIDKEMMKHFINFISKMRTIYELVDILDIINNFIRFCETVEKQTKSNNLNIQIFNRCNGYAILEKLLIDNDRNFICWFSKRRIIAILEDCR